METENLQTGLITISKNAITKPYINANAVYVEDVPLPAEIAVLWKKVETLDKKYRKLAWRNKVKYERL